MDINIVINKLAMLMLIMIFGYIARIKNVLTDEHNKGFSKLIVNVTLPCLIISSILSNETTASTSNILSIFFIGTVVFIILVILAMIIPKLFGADQLQDGVYKFCTLINNNVFMGFPLIHSILGDDALFFAAMLNIPSSFFLFTFGIYYMQKHQYIGKFSIKDVFNLGTISSIIGVAFYFAHITLPDMLKDTFSIVGNITVPLSMIVIGISLASISIKSMITDFKIYIFAIIKMIVIPITAFLVLSLFNIDEIILHVIVISLAMPGPTLCVSLAIDYESDINLSSKYVFMSTLLSLITIPLVIKLVSILSH